MSHDRAAGRLAAVRARIAAIEAGGRADSESLPFGMDEVDACLPGGGLPLGRWHEIGALPSNFQSIPVPPSDTPKGYWEGHTVVRRQGCELVHVPYLFWLPRYLPCPYVVTVHDLLEHMYRARNGSNFKRSLHFHLTRLVLKNAARIFAVSQFTKSEVQNLFGIDGGRIEVASHEGAGTSITVSLPSSAATMRNAVA